MSVKLLHRSLLKTTGNLTEMSTKNHIMHALPRKQKNTLLLLDARKLLSVESNHKIRKT